MASQVQLDVYFFFFWIGITLDLGEAKSIPFGQEIWHTQKPRTTRVFILTNWVLRYLNKPRFLIWGVSAISKANTGSLLGYPAGAFWTPFPR